MNPLRLIAVGFVLLTASWLVLLLMVIGGIESSLPLSMGAYAVSIAGLAVGLFGVADFVRQVRR